VFLVSTLHDQASSLRHYRCYGLIRFSSKNPYLGCNVTQEGTEMTVIRTQLSPKNPQWMYFDSPCLSALQGLGKQRHHHPAQAFHHGRHRIGRRRPGGPPIGGLDGREAFIIKHGIQFFAHCLSLLFPFFPDQGLIVTIYSLTRQAVTIALVVSDKKMLKGHSLGALCYYYHFFPLLRMALKTYRIRSHSLGRHHRARVQRQENAQGQQFGPPSGRVRDHGQRNNHLQRQDRCVSFGLRDILVLMFGVSNSGYRRTHDFRTCHIKQP
jgi:hypothetical protein